VIEIFVSIEAETPDEIVGTIHACEKQKEIEALAAKLTAPLFPTCLHAREGQHPVDAMSVRSFKSRIA